MANIIINVTDGTNTVPITVDEDQQLPSNDGGTKRAGDLVAGDRVCVLSGDPCVEVV